MMPRVGPRRMYIGREAMMLGGPRTMQHGHEVMSGARKEAGVRLNAADVPMCFVVDPPRVVGGRC